MTDTHEDWTTEEDADAGWVSDVDEGGPSGMATSSTSARPAGLPGHRRHPLRDVLVGIVVAGGLSLWVVRQIDPPGDPGAKLAVTIDPGATTSEIADLLETTA